MSGAQQTPGRDNREMSPFFPWSPGFVSGADRTPTARREGPSQFALASDGPPQQTPLHQPEAKPPGSGAHGWTARQA
jgi:hypothetical protein